MEDPDNEPLHSPRVSSPEGAYAVGVPRSLDDGSSVPKLKAQLKLVTQERDLLKDAASKKRYSASMDRDNLLSLQGQVPVGPGNKHLLYPNPPMEIIHHQRTNSDSAQSPSKAMNPNLSRSHSIAAAGDKSLLFSIAREPNETSPPGPKMPSVDRSHHEFLPGNPRKQPNDALKKLEQALKDIEFYRRESESYRSRYNDLLVENQRGDQEINSLRIYLEDERKEMLDLRQQLQNILNSEGGPGDSLSIMYGALLQNYEAVKDDYNLLRRRYDDLAASHQSAVAKLEHSQNFQDDGVRYKKLYQDLVTERNQLKHQCTQAIRQWDQALRERNEYKDSLVKVQRQHEEAVKEVNQAMTVRIKASKDLKRLTEERNAAMQEYSLIMSERDTVHKEIEKLQEEVSATKKKMSGMESKSKVQDDERRKLTCQVEILKREIEQALYDRDKAVKEAHEWRDKLGGGKMASDYGEHGKHSSKSKFDVEKNKRDRDGASTETLDTSASQSLSDLGTKQRMENLDQANAEIDRLRKMTEKLGGDLQDAGLEADVAKGRRDWAFSERDKVVLERESIRTLCDKLRRERDRAVSELAEALRDSDDVKKQQNEAIKENKELRERLESLEKEVRLKSLHCSPGHSHSHDSAIDSDLQEWETENIDIDMNGLGSTEDLGLDLAGGRDDLHCPSGDKPIYISSIGKGSFLDGKLKVNDCILRVNDLNCRLVERSTILNTLRNANSAVSLVVRRRKTGRRYQAVLSMAGASSPGITLDLGVYVARISPGSVAAKEGSIAVGDRILSINDRSVDHVDHIGEAVKLLNSGQDPLVITLAKSIHSQSSLGGGHLSSSSSGHNMQERFDDEQMTHAHQPHPQHSHKLPGKSGSGTISSPIKDTIRGSQEFVRKLLISRDASGSSSGGSQARHSNSALSSSSEKVYNVTKGQMGISGKESRGSMGLMETVKEKVRGRRRSSKEHSEMSSHENVSSSRDNSLSHQPEQPPKGSADVVLAELDSVLDAFHGNKNQNAAEPNAPNLNNSSGASSNKSSGKKKRNKDRDSFRSGGTWPRTRGGPVIEHGTGTILHPQKVKKERLPLAELLNNLPKYPPEATSPKKTEAEPLVAYRQDTYSHSTREPRRNRPLTTYDLLENYGRYKKSSEERFLPPPPESEMFALEARKSVYGSAFTPSDHSIDESVKSGHAEKEVLERYLKKSSSTKLHQPLSLSGTIGESEQSNNPEVATTPIDNLSSPILSSPPPPMSLTGTNTAYAALKAMHDIKPPDSAHLMRSTASGFSPYFPSSIGHHSSPRYASPPPLVSVASGDSLLGSPIPDVRQTPGSEGGLLTQSGYNQVYESPSAMNLPMGTYANTSPSAGYGYAPASDYPGAHQIPPNSKYRYSMGMSGGHVVSPSNMGSLYHHATQPPYPGSHHYSQGSSNTQGVYGHYGHRRQTDEGVSPPLYLDHHHNPERQYVSRRRENVGYPSRVRIPSNNSIGSQGSYTQIPSLSSIDGRSSSKCNSPLPIYSVQYIIRDGRPVTADTLNSRHHIRKPLPGDIRDIDIEKTSEQLGITIADGSNKGVFVSSVSENSLASQVGLQVGDQLLDVCGINLRNCNKERAALVLQQVRNSITMKVQYNPHDYRNAQEEIHLDNNNDEDDDDDSDLDVPLTQERHSSVRQRHGPQSSPPRSGSPTPRNSPKSHRGPSMHREDYGTVCGALTHSSTHSTLTRHQINQIVPNLQANLIPPRAPASPPYEPRWVSPVMKKSGDLGVRLVGGNAVGIFIHSVERDSAAHLVGLRSAEQILEYNGVNLRQATAEQAAYELAKPAEKVSLFVQYNPDKYNLVKDQPGDSYYVRAMFDRIVDINTDPSQLAFRKDDILFIDNTMYNGVPGNWSAWIVDVDGKRTQWGIIPSKYKNIERALMTNNVIEYKRRGTQYECITVEAIKDVCERNQHCILNVHLEVVERLHQNHIYPIVLLIKFKSVKQIKEVKVPTMSADRISQKDAKNIFEHTQKLEGDYKHLISDIIHAGANLMLMCAQINSKIDQEQNKTLWVPCGTIW
eukprot:TCALIF_04803-PA protein Name:"Similar to DLG5 Disks large homolog 5 (Homo sapiens)" AED:0.14 eAED:0.14 QI:159/0.90/0.87/0.96/0.90/0.93/32/0/2037